MRHVLAHGGKRITDQWSAIIGLNHCQAHFALGKVHHLQGTRIFDQAIDIVDNQLFWRDEVVNGNRFGIKQFFSIANIVRRANTRNSVWRVEKRVCHLTGHHIGFVRTGYRNQHVGIVGARLTKNTWVRTMTLHHAQVKLVLQDAQTIAVGINNCDVVVFANQVFRQRSAHLSCTQNDNLHIS